MNNILIVGFRTMDSGKTTLARALLHHFKEKGVNACGFKPKAANSIWYDYDIISDALSKGKIYGKDTKLLKSASETDLPEEIINPIHRLWIDYSNYNISNGIPNFIMDRIKLPSKEDPFLVINKPVLDQYNKYLKLIRKINCSYTIEISNIKELNNIINKYYDKAIASAYKIIKSKYDVIIIESYSDIALPWNKLENIKIILGIEPWSIHFYKPKKYLTAAQSTIKFRNNLEITTNSIKRLLEPEKEIRIEPSSSKRVIDYLKDKIDYLI